VVAEGLQWENGVEVVETETYVFIDKSELEDEEWDFEDFKKTKLQNWVGDVHRSEEYAGM